jgi:biotin operon repressor
MIEESGVYLGEQASYSSFNRDTMQQNITAFADEFGNSSFDFETQGSHFIIATVICKNDNLEKLHSDIDEIRRKHNFQTGEIKSSGVGPNHSRRIRILEDIAKFEISIYAVIVDKRQLFGKGFGVKKSFYKYLNNLLYKELYRTFPRLELFVDEHGGNDYMLEFKSYVEKHHERNLFSGSDFNIQNSKQNYFIQLADFVAGTLGYIFDETKKSEQSRVFEEILSPKISSLNFFPKEFSFKELQDTNVDESFDPKIAEVCYLRVQNFIDKETGSDQQKVDQINFLKLLLLFQRASIKNRYISTKEIFTHLNQSRQEVLKEEYFRTKVVGNLRDRGVLIASSRNGYKIPSCSRDLDNFINHGKRIVLPMLNRINEARNALKLATASELDILDKPIFSELKDLFDK